MNVSAWATENVTKSLQTHIKLMAHALVFLVAPVNLTRKPVKLMNYYSMMVFRTVTTAAQIPIVKVAVGVLTIISATEIRDVRV